jgi:ribosome-binding protein aMBF1 (putative translation factor)
MTLVERAIKRVRKAVSLHGKKPLADLVEMDDTNLRGVDRDDWNPTAETLKKLERAADIKGVPEDIQ